MYQDIIYVDKTFTPDEQKLIMEAANNLEEFCNGMIELFLTFELDPEDHETIKNNSVLLRVNSDFHAIVTSDTRVEGHTIGLCDYMSNDTKRLYLVMDRLHDSITFRTTAIHELGHFIGLGHIESPSIMHRRNNSNVLYPTFKDAKEVSKVWNVYREDLKYFKL